MSPESGSKLGLPETEISHGRQTLGARIEAQRAAGFTGLNRLSGIKKAIIFGLIIFVAGAGGYCFMQGGNGTKTPKDAGSEAASMTVSTVNPRLSQVDRHLSVNGSIAAWDSLSIGAEVNGLRIESVKVEEGDDVRAGQVLATLNSSILRAQLEQEKARLAANVAGLKKAVQPNRVEDLNSWRAALMQAEANVAQEEANLTRVRSNAANSQENARRYTELRKVGAVSQMEADNSNTAARAAEAEVISAEKRVLAMKFALRQAGEKLSMAERGGRHEDVLISQANLSESQARVKQLEAQIEQTIIRAPDQGKVVKREAHLGEITAAGKTLFKLVRKDRLELRALVPEVDLSKVSVGQDVAISGGMNSEVAFHGQVREVSPLVDDATRLGTVRIDIPTGRPDVLPGQFFHGDIALGAAPALLVPAKSVLSREGKSVVFVLEGNKVLQREVRIGEPSGDDIEIKDGLSPQDQVVLTGAGFLKDGDIVRQASELRKESR